MDLWTNSFDPGYPKPARRRGYSPPTRHENSRNAALRSITADDRPVRFASHGFWAGLIAVFARLWRRLRNLFLIRCPSCGRAIPITTRVCSGYGCHVSITFGLVVNAGLTSPWQLWHHFLDNATDSTARVLQWGHFIFSAVVLWGLLGYAENHSLDHWVPRAALATGYFLALAYLIPLLLPGIDVCLVWKRAGARSKLGLLCNCLSVMVGLHIFITAWWNRTLLLAVLFVMAAIACALAGVVLSGLIQGPSESAREFDPLDPQGRVGRYD